MADEREQQRTGRQAAPEPTGGRTVVPVIGAVEQQTRVEQGLEHEIEMMPEPAGADGEQSGNPVAAGAATKTLADAEPKGPDPDLVEALVEARVRRIDKRRAASGKKRARSSERSYTLTASAQAAYLSRGKTLFARYKRETDVVGADEDMDPRRFVYWLFSLKLTLSPSSWRLYRLAARARIQTLPHEAMQEAVSMLEGDVGARANEVRAQRGRQEGGHAQPGLAKRIDKADFDAVLDSLLAFSRSQMVPCLQDWMVAGIHSGLQPSEWATAILETRQDPNHMQPRRAWLHVVNAKATHGAHRTLDISDFSDATFAAVERLIDRAEKWSLEEEFDRRRSQCNGLLGEAFAALFPRQQQRCSLDSLHHQFIANMKTRYARAEIAALVGYVSNETAVDFYGKRRLAWPDHEIREVPIPIATQVTRMRERLDLYELRRKMLLARRAMKVRNRDDNPAVAVEPGPDAEPEPAPG